MKSLQWRSGCYMLNEGPGRNLKKKRFPNWRVLLFYCFEDRRGCLMASVRTQNDFWQFKRPSVQHLQRRPLAYGRRPTGAQAAVMSGVKSPKANPEQNHTGNVATRRGCVNSSAAAKKKKTDLYQRRPFFLYFINVHPFTASTPSVSPGPP